MNLGFVINSLGRMALTVGLFMLSTFIWVIYYNEYHVVSPLLVSVLIPIIIGMVMLFITRSKTRKVSIADRYVLVTLTWVYIGIFGALPFYITGSVTNFIDALFESISGFTSTGCTILTDIEALPKSLLYWRSLSQWIGGLGIIVLAIAVFPMFKTSGYQIFSLEASVLLNQKLKPRTTDIAKRLWFIYLILTIILVLLLLLGGMNLFESICHSFATIGTGGFSPRNTSIESYSRYIQYTIAVFMIISGMNFTLHYFFLKGNLRRIFYNSELRLYLAIIAVVTVLVTLVLIFSDQYGLEESFRYAFFQVTSIITTTGFATADYIQWSTPAWVLIIALLFVGGCVGSTSGGLKVIRHLVAFKYLKKHIIKVLHPTAVVSLKINKMTIQDNQAQSIIVFIMLYLVIFTLGYLAMSSLGLDMLHSFGTVAACLGCTGPGIGTVGPASNYAHIPDIGKLVLSLLMIIGRLELFTFMIILTPSFWRSSRVRV